MKKIKQIKYRKAHFEKPEPDVPHYKMDFLPLVSKEESMNATDLFIEKGSDLLLFKEPNIIRLINTSLLEQIIVYDYYPNPSQTTLHTIPSNSSIKDVISTLILEEYVMLNLPNLKYSTYWGSALEVLFTTEMKDVYPNPIYPLTRLTNFPLDERLRVALRSI